MKRLLVTALVFLAACLPASAQQSAGFAFNAATSISASTTSSSAALPGTGSKVLVQNTGTITAYLAFGNSAVVATTSGMPVTGGTCIFVQSPGTYTTIAAITGSSTTTVLLTQGEGDPPISCPVAGGTAANVTVVGPLGQTTMASSIPVVIASNQSAVSVNCTVGCAGGTSSNASDAVATSATNGQTLAWLYGFNGTTFDRLRVDASKNLNVNIAANSFGTVTVTGTVAATQSGTWTVQPGNTANTTPWLVTGSGTAGTAATGVLTVQGIASMTPVQVSQATAASLNATVVGTGTFAVQAAQSGNWTTRIVGNTAGVLDFAGQNAGSPANAVLMGGQFNTTPTTITAGNSSPFQLDNAGNLLVNIKAGGSTGATSNASSGVATSSNNTPTVAYTYGFNGSTWDQLQVDGSKNLKVTGGVAQASTTSGQTGSLILAATTTAAPAYTNATTNAISLDPVGNVRVGIGPTSTASMGIAPVVSGAAEANHVLKASAGNLYSFQVTSGASAGFVLVFDATSAPADGAVTPKKCYQIAANASTAYSWIPGPPLNFATGITVSFSTTGCFTKTASATAFISGEVQ